MAGHFVGRHFGLTEYLIEGRADRVFSDYPIPFDDLSHF